MLSSDLSSYKSYYIVSLIKFSSELQQFSIDNYFSLLSSPAPSSQIWLFSKVKFSASFQNGENDQVASEEESFVNERGER